MSYVEAEGSSIDEAIDKALQSLGVAREQVEIDILASPTRGVLGIGGRKAKVRVSVRKPVRLDTAEEPQPAPPAAPPEMAPLAPAAPAVPVDHAMATRAQQLLQEILDRMGFAVSIRAATTADEIHLSIDGDSSGVLIGRHGQTLDAFEYFLHRVLAREEREEGVGRIMVDCEGYRDRRRETLQAMAARLAQQAKTKRKPVTMDALSPRERRIVHLALQNEAGVSTRSSGDGYYRKLVIIPAGEYRSPRPPKAGNPRSGNQSAAR